MKRSSTATTPSRAAPATLPLRMRVILAALRRDLLCCAATEAEIGALGFSCSLPKSGACARQAIQAR